MYFLIVFSTLNQHKPWKYVKKFDKLIFSDIQWLSHFQKNVDFYNKFLIPNNIKDYKVKKQN